MALQYITFNLPILGTTFFSEKFLQTHLICSIESYFENKNKSSYVGNFTNMWKNRENTPSSNSKEVSKVPVTQKIKSEDIQTF